MQHDTINKEKSQALQSEVKTTSENAGRAFLPPPFQLKASPPTPPNETGESSGKSKGGLPGEVQSGMEQTLGADFSNVNIHTGSQSAKDMGALAYTQGNDVHFAPGQFNPGSNTGKELIGHELAHVVQQREGRVKPTTETAGKPVNDDPGLEKEADVKGAQAATAIQAKMASPQPMGRPHVNSSQSAIQAKMAPVQFALDTEDIDAICQHLNKAMKGWGTDEEQIFVHLQKLGKNASDISKLKTAYKNKYKTELEADLRSELSGDELRLALEMIGIKDDVKKDDLIDGAAPGTDLEYKAVVQRLQKAMKGWGTSEEEIYGVLIPFNRDKTKLDKLKTTYETETGNKLEEDLKSEMSGEELAYALFLLNAPPPKTTANAPGITATGTEDHKESVIGGEVTVRTGDTYTGTTYTDLFSMGYEGGLASETRWLQFIWREIHVTDSAGKTTALTDTITSSTNTYDLTSNPSSPNYSVDAFSSETPFYEDRDPASGKSGLSGRNADNTTIYDQPSGRTDIASREFGSGATKVESKAHFHTFLVRDYQPMYQIDLTVSWDYTSAATPPRSQSVENTKEVKKLPGKMKKALEAQRPEFSYIL